MSHHTNLSKMTKHWGSFFTHCKYHHIQECVIEKRIVLHFVPTTEQIADIMTKCLSYDKFKKFRNLLGITIP